MKNNELLPVLNETGVNRKLRVYSIVWYTSLTIKQAIDKMAGRKTQGIAAFLILEATDRTRTALSKGSEIRQYIATE
jgi:hypothetical protein